MVESGLRSVCFCCVSTGIYGYPNGRAAEVAVETVTNWLKDGDNRYAASGVCCTR
jgi:O-acetyl-ADP-ribose deacetylase (regulator of RNase III)